MRDRAREPWAFEDVRKDPLDLRDWYYVPGLQPLPLRIDNRAKVPKPVRHQGKEGSCTGFGLMAVANYLIHNRRDIDPKMKVSVSPRMFYEMAKRYDEWTKMAKPYDERAEMAKRRDERAREEDQGSSIRGAMKGWYKHGVCLETEWPYVENQRGRLTPRRQRAALRRPLGAYYRVRHLHLNHMHSALHDVGILYASAAIHEGWGNADHATGEIPFRRPGGGGHAFAIVGYDEDGFWIQNSWGTDWGLGGFGHISYDDWLENGYDCWVAQLGVPTTNEAFKERTVTGRVTEFDYVPHQAVVFDSIRPYFVDLGNDGRLSTSGLYSNDAKDVREIIHRRFKDEAQKWDGTPKLFLYAHGGLNDEKASASRIYSMLPYFLANEIYPLHFMWETGLGETFRNILQDAVAHRRFEGWLDSMKERFGDLLDEAIELGARVSGRPMWREMKENAKLASVSRWGGAALVARQIAERAHENPVELHLAGHSAGSVLLAHLIPRLIRLGLPIKTLTLYAPACTTKLFIKSKILDSLEKGQIERLTVFNLTDEYEKKDTATPLYHKSLLYLVSGACEEERNEPLLGMNTFIERDEDLKKALGKPIGRNDSTVIYSVGGPSDISLASQSTTHGGFDNDEATLNSTLRIIRATNELDKEFLSSPR